MKKTVLAISSFLMLSCLMMAGDSQPLTMINKTGTVSTATSAKFNGFLDSIYFNITGTTTGTVVVSRGGETLLTKAITADSTIRPRVAVQNVLGATDAVCTNTLERFLLVEEALTLTLSEAAPATNTYSILIRVDNK